MKLPRKFELHYYLAAESHSMSALVKNRCEAEFLAVALEVTEILDIELEFESEALRAGGLREIWRAIGDNGTQIAIVISVLALILSASPSTDQELVELQKEDERLSIEERKLIIEKLKKEVKEESISNDSVNTAAKVVSESVKIATRKSNFYKLLAAYEKVTQIGFSALDERDRRTHSEKVVSRENFHQFILNSQDLKPLKDNSARVEIVAPVLTDGKAKWKGNYDGLQISFAMNDKVFRSSVLSKQISFKNGDEILCALHIHKKINELGDVVTAGYSVEVVLENIHSGLAMKTQQGREYLHSRKLIESQSDMFSNDKA